MLEEVANSGDRRFWEMEVGKEDRCLSSAKAKNR